MCGVRVRVSMESLTVWESQARDGKPPTQQTHTPATQDIHVKTDKEKRNTNSVLEFAQARTHTHTHTHAHERHIPLWVRVTHYSPAQIPPV